MYNSPRQYDFVLLCHGPVRVEGLEGPVLGRMPELVRAEVEDALLVGHEGGRGEEAAAVGVGEDLAHAGHARAVQAEQDLAPVKVYEAA